MITSFKMGYQPLKFIIILHLDILLSKNTKIDKDNLLCCCSPLDSAGVTMDAEVLILSDLTKAQGDKKKEECRKYWCKWEFLSFLEG